MTNFVYFWSFQLILHLIFVRQIHLIPGFELTMSQASLNYWTKAPHPLFKTYFVLSLSQYVKRQICQFRFIANKRKIITLLSCDQKVIKRLHVVTV